MTGASKPVRGPLNLSRTELRDSAAFLIETQVRIEIAATHRKQRKATKSNRNFFRGPGCADEPAQKVVGPHVPERIFGAALALASTACADFLAQLRSRASGRGSHGAAGIDPRHRPVRPSHPTACAGSLAQSGPCERRPSIPLQDSSFRQAKKRLIATVANSKNKSTHSKRCTKQISNRNKFGCFVIRRREQRLGGRPVARVKQRPFNPDAIGISGQASGTRYAELLRESYFLRVAYRRARALPEPSSMVRKTSTGRLVTVSRRPLGHQISSESTRVREPRPKKMRGSCADR
jgi:hypothetical protein